MMNDYTHFAHIYDDFVDEQFVARLIDVLEHYARRYPPPGNRMLDLACGTGTIALHFARRGWLVTGVDLSHAMLEKAAVKAVDAGIDLELEVADMRWFELGGTVDLITCNSDSINHLSDEKDIAATFASVSRSLAPGGVFIFDINTPHTLRKKWSGDTIAGKRGIVSYSWHHSFDEGSDTGILDATFKLRKDGEIVVFGERFHERVFEADRIEELLRESGLRMLEAADFFTLRPLEAESVRATIVAARPE